MFNVDPDLIDAKIDCTHRILDRLLENDPENSIINNLNQS